MESFRQTIKSTGEEWLSCDLNHAYFNKTVSIWKHIFKSSRSGSTHSKVVKNKTTGVHFKIHLPFIRIWQQSNRNKSYSLNFVFFCLGLQRLWLTIWWQKTATKVCCTKSHDLNLDADKSPPQDYISQNLNSGFMSHRCSTMDRYQRVSFGHWSDT